MDKATETAQVSPPKAEPKSAPEQAVITLEHPSWGRYVFRLDESKIAQTFPDQVRAAKRDAEVRGKVAALDKAQHDLEADVQRARAKSAAADVLGDKTAKANAEKEVDSIRARQNALAQERAKLLEA